MHEFTAVTVRVIAPGVAGQFLDVIVSQVFEILAAPQLLPEGCDRCCEVQAFTAGAGEIRIRDRRLHQPRRIFNGQLVADTQVGQFVAQRAVLTWLCIASGLVAALR